jgi:hypothetical protein
LATIPLKGIFVPDVTEINVTFKDSIRKFSYVQI